MDYRYRISNKVDDTIEIDEDLKVSINQQLSAPQPLDLKTVFDNEKELFRIIDILEIKCGKLNAELKEMERLYDIISNNLEYIKTVKLWEKKDGGDLIPFMEEILNKFKIDLEQNGLTKEIKKEHEFLVSRFENWILDDIRPPHYKRAEELKETLELLI